MSVQNDILDMLCSSSEVLSGEELAEKLKVSRNAVWKAVQALKDGGCEITAVRNMGYKLVGLGNYLSEGLLREKLSGKAVGLKLEIKHSVSSTNSVLKEIADTMSEDMVLIADEQKQGRGRLGRSFLSPNGGLYMSILLHPKISAQQSLLITTAAAVATARAIKAVTDKDVEIKWVNDLFYQGKKICGILTEANLDFESGGLNYAVLGIGVNINEPAEGFPKELQGIAGALYKSEEGIDEVRLKLAAEILNIFFEYYEKLEEKAFMEEYRRLSFLTGKSIVFTQGNVSESGEVIDIDDDARLVVRLENGETKAYMAGEVSIVKGWVTNEN